MPAIDTKWYNFTLPHWSNIPPPLTDRTSKASIQS